MPWKGKEGLYSAPKSQYLYLMEKGKYWVIWKVELKEVAQGAQ